MSEEAWKSAFFLAIGVTVAVVLLAGAQVSGSAAIQPAWPSTYPFGLGGHEVIAPYLFGGGTGNPTTDACQFLFVEFNATYPADLWVIPGGAGVVFHNGTPYFSAILWSSGPAVTAKIAIELAHGGGYGIWTANPGPNSTSLYWSAETETCL